MGHVVAARVTIHSEPGRDDAEDTDGERQA